MFSIVAAADGASIVDVFDCKVNVFSGGADLALDLASLTRPFAPTSIPGCDETTTAGFFNTAVRPFCIITDAKLCTPRQLGKPLHERQQGGFC